MVIMTKKKIDKAYLYQRCVAQKNCIERNFDCFSCKIFKSDQLVCFGEIAPDIDSDTYTVRIRYHPLEVPKVHIMSPEIINSPNIHRYADMSLCLYFPPDDPWKKTDLIHKKLIPWTSEWLVYYELYLHTGDWLGPEAPHPPT